VATDIQFKKILSFPVIIISHPLTDTWEEITVSVLPFISLNSLWLSLVPFGLPLCLQIFFLSAFRADYQPLKMLNIIPVL
jgi:hypothetical protein